MLVTPTLFVGSAPEYAVPASTAKQAVRLIEAGEIVVLPEGAWREAEKVVATFSKSSKVASLKVTEAQQYL